MFMHCLKIISPLPTYSKHRVSNLLINTIGLLFRLVMDQVKMPKRAAKHSVIENYFTFLDPPVMAVGMSMFTFFVMGCVLLGRLLMNKNSLQIH